MFGKKLKKRDKKKIAGDTKITFIKSGAIDAYLDKHRYDEKNECLEIGDIGPKDNFLTVDIRSEADFVGDIRGAITNDYPESPGIASIPIGNFKIIKMVNTIEHIQWIYQDALLNWVHSLLADGGMLYIDTPNLEYITRIYLANLANQAAGLPVNFPAGEYPGMADENGKPKDGERDLQKWVNFKLFSGCSPGDFHHCCYDAYWLGRMLDDAGFHKINICSEDTLKAVAFKVGDRDVTAMDQAVERYIR